MGRAGEQGTEGRRRRTEDGWQKTDGRYETQSSGYYGYKKIRGKGGEVIYYLLLTIRVEVLRLGLRPCFPQQVRGRQDDKVILRLRSLRQAQCKRDKQDKFFGPPRAEEN